MGYWIRISNQSGYSGGYQGGHRLEFGWLPQRIRYDCGFTIEPLARADVEIQRVKRSHQICSDWYYPPSQPPGDDLFGLPSTHRIVHPGADELKHFLIVAFGFLMGMKLIPAGWIHFYRVPIRIGALHDLVLTTADVENVMRTAESFWVGAPPSIRTLMFSAIHFFLFSQCYRHDFEVFAGQYTVLDTCYRIGVTRGLVSGKLSHAERPSSLATSLGASLPSWATVQRKGAATSCTLSDVRNRLVHEGHYGREPTGFGYPAEPNIVIELIALNSRLLLALLGVKGTYISSSCQSRNHFSLGLPTG